MIIMTLGALLLGVQAGVPATPPSTRPAAGDLPARRLACTVHRIINFDPDKDQKPSDFLVEGNHRLDLFLPAAPRRTTPPPEATDPPEPVDPRIRIVADPDGLTRGIPNGFDRVVDDWPDRVEMTTTIRAPLVNLVIVEAIDTVRRTATLFMTRASDAVTYDRQHLYSGRCAVVLGPAAADGG